MSAYTPKQLKEIGTNPYTYKVTKSRVYFTAEFMEIYWQSYQNGETGREILKKCGYNPDYFSQSKIDHLTRRIKEQAQKGEFSEGTGGQRHARKSAGCPEMTPENMQELWVQYLDQEVESLKKAHGAGHPMTKSEKFAIIQETRKEEAMDRDCGIGSISSRNWHSEQVLRYRQPIFRLDAASGTRSSIVYSAMSASIVLPSLTCL